MTANKIKWVKVGQDYRSQDGRFTITRMPGWANAYNPGKDEWTLVDGKEPVDVYPLLREAKAAAESMAVV